MADEAKTVPMSEFTELQNKYNKLDDRAKRFEGMATDLEKRLKTFDGVDLEALKASREELDILKREQAEKGDQKDLEAWQKATAKEIEEKVRKDAQKEIDALREENDKLKTSEKTYLVTDKAWNDISSMFTSDSTPLIKPYVEKYVDKDEEGNFVIKDDKGEVRFSPDNPNAKLSISDFAKEIASKHPSCAASTTKSGSLQQGQKMNGSVDGLTVQQFMDMGEAGRAQLPKDVHRKLSVEYMQQQKQ